MNNFTIISISFLSLITLSACNLADTFDSMQPVSANAKNQIGPVFIVSQGYQTPAEWSTRKKESFKVVIQNIANQFNFTHTCILRRITQSDTI